MGIVLSNHSTRTSAIFAFILALYWIIIIMVELITHICDSVLLRLTYTAAAGHLIVSSSSHHECDNHNQHNFLAFSTGSFRLDGIKGHSTILHILWFYWWMLRLLARKLWWLSSKHSQGVWISSSQAAWLRIYSLVSLAKQLTCSR